MNSLEINKEVKRVDFSYTTTNYKFTGTCDVHSDLSVDNINVSVAAADGIHIGNCNSNGNASVNIYSAEYKDKIADVAADFKILQDDLINHYSTTTFAE